MKGFGCRPVEGVRRFAEGRPPKRFTLPAVPTVPIEGLFSDRRSDLEQPFNERRTESRQLDHKTAIQTRAFQRSLVKELGKLAGRN